MSKKNVYVAMSADVVHGGHIELLRQASMLGQVTVGLLTDAAIASYKRLPLFPFEQRKKIVESLTFVTKVVSQQTLDYRPNLQQLKPEIVVHGDDWREGIQKVTRQQVLDVLPEWGGELVEFPYTQSVSSSEAQQQLKRNGISAPDRQSTFRRLLNTKSLVRVMEVHSPLSARIVENSRFMKNGELRQFDALWASSLTDSTVRGKPDNEVVNITSRIQTINEIFEVTHKPLVYDADTGGQVEHFEHAVRSLERLGVSVAVVEDKVGLKRNSLLSGDVLHELAPVADFCRKLLRGKQAQVGDDFMIVARLESLIAGAGIDDALLRAQAYIGAGADGILIHSKKKDGSEVLEFARRFRNMGFVQPLFAVPTTYNQVSEAELRDAGFTVVIYANHMLRSAYPAMQRAAESVLEHERAFEAESVCCPIDEMLAVVEGN